MKKQKGTIFFNNASAGFTLIEVIIALAVLTIGILSVNVMHTVSIRGNATASGITTSANWAADRVERIFSLNYGNDDLKDTDADGSAGLDADVTTATADHNWTSPDGRYTVLWNVAEEYPMPNIKTIHVIVNRSDRGETKTVTFRYKKSRYM